MKLFAFLLSSHCCNPKQEMKELAALAYRDTTQENRDYWKNEMAGALREIQACYDEKLDVMKGELDTFYNLKVSVVRQTLGVVRLCRHSMHLESFNMRSESMSWCEYMHAWLCHVKPYFFILV